MLKKTLLKLTFCLAVVVWAGGCGDSSTTEENNSTEMRKKLVIFSQCNNAEPYRAAQNKLFRQLMDQETDIDYEIMDAQQDNSKQISQIETAIRKKPHLLIVAPNEAAPLTRIMGRAMEAGIPTICLERNIKEPNYTTYIKCDNYAIGKLAGEFIAAELKRRNGSVAGNMVDIRGLKGVEAELNRHDGAREALEPYEENMNYVAEAVADWLQSKARERMTEILRAHENIDVVYGHNDPMAVGAYLAAADLGREDEMFFVGVDGLGGSAGGIKKVMDGVLAATFIYPLCIDKAVEVGLKIIRDPEFQPEKEYIMESQMITPENAAEIYEEVTVED